MNLTKNNCCEDAHCKLRAMIWQVLLLFIPRLEYQQQKNVHNLHRFTTFQIKIKRFLCFMMRPCNYRIRQEKCNCFKERARFNRFEMPKWPGNKKLERYVNRNMLRVRGVPYTTTTTTTAPTWLCDNDKMQCC